MHKTGKNPIPESYAEIEGMEQKKTPPGRHPYLPLWILLLLTLSIFLSAAAAEAAWADEEQQLMAREQKILQQKQAYVQKNGEGKSTAGFDHDLQIIAGERTRLAAEKKLAAENGILMGKVADYLKSRGCKVDLQGRDEDRTIRIAFSREGKDIDVGSGEVHSRTFRYEADAARDFDSIYKSERENRSTQELNKIIQKTSPYCGESGCSVTVSQFVDVLQDLPLPSAKAFFAGTEKSSQTEYYTRAMVKKLPQKRFNDESSFHFVIKRGALFVHFFCRTEQTWTDDPCCTRNSNVSSADKVFRLREDFVPGAQFGTALARFIDAAMGKDDAGKAAAETKLQIEPMVIEVKPDGVSQATLHFYATGRSTESQAALVPVPNADIRVEILPDQGKTLGTLSAKEVLTGADGKARLIYTAPPKELWQIQKPDRTEMKVTSQKLGLTDAIYVSYLKEGKITINARHAILPAHRDFDNALTLSFEDPRKDWGKKYRAVARCSTQNGRIVLNGKEAGEMTLEVVSGAPNSIAYRWVGPQPADKAVEEVVEITIPDLGLKEKIPFSVGIDLMLDAAIPGAKGALHPNLFVPFKVYVRDRFHPNADLGTLFKDFDIRPELAIEPISFAPIAAGSPFSERFVQNLVKGVEGAVMPHGHHARGIPPGSGTVLKDDDGRWLLLNRSAEPADRYPGVIPFDLGNYLFRVKLIPAWKGDAGPTLQEISLQVAVEDIRPEEEMFLTFLLPTLQAYIALYPGLDAFALTGKITALVYEGKYKTAVRELAKEFLFGKIGEKGGELLNDELVKILEKKLPKAAFEKLAARLKTLKGTDGADFIIDQMNLDLVGALAGTLVDELEEATIGKLLNDDEKAPPAAGNKRAGEKDAGSILFLQEMMAGGRGYGVILLPRKGVTAVGAAGTNAAPFEEAPPQILDGDHPRERIHKKEKVYALPFRDKETLTLNVAGDGKTPVRILRITPDGVSSRYYPQPEPWKKTITVK